MWSDLEKIGRVGGAKSASVQQCPLGLSISRRDSMVSPKARERNERNGPGLFDVLAWSSSLCSFRLLQIRELVVLCM